MKFMHEYIQDFRSSGDAHRSELRAILESARSSWDIHAGGSARDAFDRFVQMYNWLGQATNKSTYDITQNLARNLPGSLMQDYLLHLLIQVCQAFPQLDVFTEVPVPFGHYPLWDSGEVQLQTPSERSDLALGYLTETEEICMPTEPWPRQPYYRLESHQSIIPLVTVNSKIRVSQSEFFDWLGRGQLMAKGNPHCLSIQVALRKEMDSNIVEAAQAANKFFLIGEGNEGNVVPRPTDFSRMISTITTHLTARMT